MTDTTQDLVNSYSEKAMAGYGPMSSSVSPYKLHPTSADKYLEEGLNDPLEDTAELNVPTRTHVPAVTLPPTPNESPIKSSMDRLRGSPIKTPRRQFRTPKQGVPRLSRPIEIQENSPLSVSEFDVDFDPKSVFHPEVVSGTKHLGGYQTLLSSSTDKLTRELHLERARNYELQQEVAQLSRQNSEFLRMKNDLESLEKQNHALRSKNFSLELQVNNFQRNDKSEHMTRENKLLREKLLKYKNLYDASVKSNNKANDNMVKDVSTSNHSNEKELPQVEKKKKFRASKQKNVSQTAKKVRTYIESPSQPSTEEESDEEMDEDFSDSPRKSASGKPVKVWDDVAFMNQLQRVLNSMYPQPFSHKSQDILQPGMPEPHMNARFEKQKPRPSNSSHENPQVHPQNYSSKPSEPLPETFPQTLPEPLPEARISSETRVESDVYHAAGSEPEAQNVEPRQTASNCKDQFSRLEQILNLIREDVKRQNAQTFPQAPAEPKPQSNGPSTCSSKSNKSKPQVNAPARPNTARTCTACSEIESQSRPVSESTPKEGNDTQELMGKFMWNRTL